MPEAAVRRREHVAETRRHGERLEQCLRVLNRTPSTVKSMCSSLMGWAEGASTSLFTDQPVKDMLMDYVGSAATPNRGRVRTTGAMQTVVLSIACHPSGH